MFRSLFFIFRRHTFAVREKGLCFSEKGVRRRRRFVRTRGRTEKFEEPVVDCSTLKSVDKDINMLIQ